MLAPLHIEVELEGMKIVESLLGPVLQVGVFDTGLFRQMPQSSVIYPGPYDWFKRGIHVTAFTVLITNTAPSVPPSCLGKI